MTRMELLCALAYTPIGGIVAVTVLLMLLLAVVEPSRGCTTTPKASATRNPPRSSL